jgi:hypothetical protein
MPRGVRLQLGRALAFIDGAPDVTGLPCDKISSAEAGDYMRRYHLELAPDRAIRFHHILASDPGHDLHDHPWDFVSVMLDGAYTEITPSGAVRYEAPCVITRKAEQLHRLVLEDPVWTYVVCGRVRRRWGFATRDGWVPWQRYPGRAAIGGCEPRPRRLSP